MNNKTGWRRMAQIAEQSMEDNDYDIEDVKNGLVELRECVKKPIPEGVGEPKTENEVDYMNNLMEDLKGLNTKLEKQYFIQESYSMFSQEYRDSLSEEIAILKDKKNILTKVSDRLK